MWGAGNLDDHEKGAKIVAAYGGLLVPVAILAATAWLSSTNAGIAARDKCIDRGIQIVAEHLPDQPLSPTLAAERRLVLAATAEFALQSCNTAGLELPAILTRTLQEEQAAAAGTPAEGVFDELVERAEQMTAQGGRQNTAAAPPADAQASASFRVFLHIASEDQREAARQLELQLEAATLGGRAIVVPGIELVERGGDNTVRCLKRSDCQLADELVGFVNARVQGARLRPVDLSARFENAAGVRSGTYEIWFSPGDLSVRTAGGTTGQPTQGGTT